MTTAEKSFLISIRQCDKAQLLRLQYAVYTAGWENKLTYALLGTIGDTNNGPFRLNGVVKLQDPSTITKVTALLYLYGDFTVVPTNADFSSYNIRVILMDIWHMARLMVHLLNRTTQTTCLLIFLMVQMIH